MDPFGNHPRRSSARVRRGKRATSRAFRVVVPVVLTLLGVAAAGIAVLAAAVLMGWLPYPGR